jgi:PAS domain S-box-containing protein
LLGVLALAAVYFGAAKLGLSMAFLAEQVTLVWPPTGIALAAVLVFGPRCWPGIALGAFLANATANEPIPVACGIAAGNTLEALLGAWLLRRLVEFRPSLERLRDALGLVVLAGAVSTTVSATIGVLSLCVGGVQAWSDFAPLWAVWWLGDAMGNLVMAPVLLTWAAWPWKRLQARELVEGVILFVGLAAVSVVVFTQGRAPGGTSYPLEYTIFPFVIWAALRQGQAAAATVVLIALGIAIAGTVNGVGPFARARLNESLIPLQLYMAVVAVTSLLLGAAVSERMRAEESLRGSHGILQGVTEGTTDAVFVKDTRGHYLMINSAGARFLGKAVAEVLGRDDTELVSPDTAEVIQEWDRKVMATGTIQTYEEQVTAVGVTRTFLATKGPYRDAQGKVIGLVGIARDISERKRVAEALRESEEWLRLALDAGKIGAWDWDVVKNQVTWSERIYEFHGMAPGAFGGRVEDFATLVHAEDRERVSAAVRRAFEDGAPYEIEFRIVRPGGEVRWIATSGRVLYDPAGQPVRMLGATLDTTQRRAAEEALRQADRRKDEFLAMLAHELRNPLAPIRNALHILKMPDVPAPLLAQVRGMMERQVQHLVRLVDDLLDVSRIMRGKIQLRKEPLDLAAVISRAVETAQPGIEAQGHQLTVALPAEPVRLEGDLIRLAQVLANLLNNAAKYTERGGHIRLTAEAGRGEVAVRVRDNGIGIAPEMQGSIFDLFVQADQGAAHAQGGLGIGLTLVRRLVEMHGGSVSVSSPGLGQGSEFVVRLPAMPGARDDIHRPAEGSAAPVQAAAELRHLLVVDDNEDAAESLAVLLRLGGHEVRVAHDGPGALQAARERPPDLVFLDIGMAGMDGYEVARRLRQEPGWGQRRLVAVTGWGQDEDRRRAQEAGFDYHLTKPADPVALQKLLAVLTSPGAG